MMKIIALTNHGGMIIGKEYEVGAEIASILTSVKRAKYSDDGLNPVEEKVKSVTSKAEAKPKTIRRKTKK